MTHTADSCTCHTRLTLIHVTHSRLLYMSHTTNSYTCHTQPTHIHVTHDRLLYISHTADSYTCHTRLTLVHVTHGRLLYMSHTADSCTCHTQPTLIHVTHGRLLYMSHTTDSCACHTRLTLHASSTQTNELSHYIYYIVWLIRQVTAHFVRQLEKEQQILENQLRDMEWRLDQESKVTSIKLTPLLKQRVWIIERRHSRRAIMEEPPTVYSRWRVCLESE